MLLPRQCREQNTKLILLYLKYGRQMLRGSVDDDRHREMGRDGAEFGNLKAVLRAFFAIFMSLLALAADIEWK